jgi:hypothetical protein
MLACCACCSWPLAVRAHTFLAERRADLELNQEGIRFRDILTSEAQVKAAGQVPNVHLVAIRHGLPFDGGPDWPTDAVEHLWAELQNDLAELTPQGKVVVAAHAITGFRRTSRRW